MPSFLLSRPRRTYILADRAMIGRPLGRIPKKIQKESQREVSLPISRLDPADVKSPPEEDSSAGGIGPRENP